MSEAAATSPRAEARRERLLEAAETVFTREGLRGASMERIAAEAGVARATVYAYFTDKEDAFRQVSQRLADRLVDAVTAALAKPGTPAERIRNGILAKHLLAWEVARTSPHAADLFAAKDRLAGPVFAGAERRIAMALVHPLETLGAPEPKQAALLILASAKGVAAASDQVLALTANLTNVLRWLASGITADALLTDCFE